MLHLEIKKFCSHPSTKDIPFKKVELVHPGAPWNGAQIAIQFLTYFSNISLCRVMKHFTKRPPIE
uniref:Uncharacterized protein n=1 Tax=Medicago truncatula TaxID=3880 RepID=I3SU11_MEDTR|nr:unknown [Medicago truncatula]